MSLPPSATYDCSDTLSEEDIAILDALSSDPHSWLQSDSVNHTNSLCSISSSQWSLTSDPELAFDLEVDFESGKASPAIPQQRTQAERDSMIHCFKEESGGYINDSFEDMSMDLCLSQPLMDPWESPFRVDLTHHLSDAKGVPAMENDDFPSSPLRSLLDHIVEEDDKDEPPTVPSQHSCPNDLLMGPSPLQNAATDPWQIRQERGGAFSSPLQLHNYGLPRTSSSPVQPSSEQIRTSPDMSRISTDGYQHSWQYDEDGVLLDSPYTSTKPRSRSWVMEQVESKVADLLEALAQGNTPQLEIDSRSSNKVMTEFDIDQGIYRRRRPMASNDPSQEKTPDPITNDESLEAIDRTTEIDYADLSEDDDLFQHDASEEDSPVIPVTQESLTSQSNKVNPAGLQDSLPINNGASSVQQPAKKSVRSTTMKGTKLLRMTQKGIKQLTAIIRVMDIIHESVQNNVYITKRDMFYRDVATFRQQVVVDRTIDDLAATFRVPRSSLHVVAGSRGLVCGSIHLITWQHDQNIRDLSSKADGSTLGKNINNGLSNISSNTPSLGISTWIGSSQPCSIPALEEVIQVKIHPDTRFVLVIEKEATMKYLMSTGFCEKHGPCILLTGKGNPDRATRQLLNCLSRMAKQGVTVWYPNDIDEARFIEEWDDGIRLASENTTSLFHRGSPSERGYQLLKQRHTTESAALSSQVPLKEPCPLLAIVDCDPYGFWIFFTYKHGSPQMAFDNLNLAVPQLRCLGQVPQDWFTCFENPKSTKTIYSSTTRENSGCNAPPTDDTRTTLAKPARRKSLQQPAKALSQQQPYISSPPLPTLLPSPILPMSAASSCSTLLPPARSMHPWDRHLRPLTSSDRARLFKLLTMPFVTVSPGWKKQLSKMLWMNRKSELQSLYESSWSYSSSQSIAARQSTKYATPPTTPFTDYLIGKLNDEGTWL
ncbi:endodeoxyribonuclease [Actinomortierella wolfii]|nr:endodeoxyribonuclease [Actinomortierella wolfii]